MRLDETTLVQCDQPGLTCLERFLSHSGCREDGLNIAACIKCYKFVQTLIVFIDLNLASKVKGG